MPCIHPDTRFRYGLRAATKWCETTTNMSFGPKEVDWARSLQKNKKWFLGHKVTPCMHPDTHFRNGSRAATKWRETTPNMSFGPKEVDWACSLRKNKKWFRGHKLIPCMHADTRFRNGSRAATKWRETTPDPSFRPKVVDLACSLRKNKKWFGGHKLMPCMHPDTRFCNGSHAATKRCKTTPS